MKTSPLLSIASLICFALLSMSLVAFISSETEPHSAALAQVNIQFGRGPNCTSRGICSVDAPSGSPSFSGGNLSPAQITYRSNNQLVITIFKTDISVSAMQTQFVNGTFEQLESISFTDPNLPESSPPVSIAVGSYTVDDLGDRYSISF